MLGLQPGILINNRFSLYAAKALIPLEAPEESPHPFPCSFILVFNKGIREILNLINSVQLWVFSVQLCVTNLSSIVHFFEIEGIRELFKNVDSKGDDRVVFD